MGIVGMFINGEGAGRKGEVEETRKGVEHRPEAGNSLGWPEGEAWMASSEGGKGKGEGHAEEHREVREIVPKLLSKPSCRK